MQLVWRPTCPTIYEIKQFHLPDVDVSDNLTVSDITFPKQPILVSSVLHTFLLPLRSSKRNYVLCFVHTKSENEQ